MLPSVPHHPTRPIVSMPSPYERDTRRSLTAELRKTFYREDESVSIRPCRFCSLHLHM